LSKIGTQTFLGVSTLAYEACMRTLAMKLKTTRPHSTKGR